MKVGIPIAAASAMAAAAQKERERFLGFSMGRQRSALRFGCHYSTSAYKKRKRKRSAGYSPRRKVPTKKCMNLW